jgi:hypothetical protein
MAKRASARRNTDASSGRRIPTGDGSLPQCPENAQPNQGAVCGRMHPACAVRVRSASNPSLPTRRVATRPKQRNPSSRAGSRRCRRPQAASSSNRISVGAPGFEPTTSCLQTVTGPIPRKARPDVVLTCGTLRYNRVPIEYQYLPKTRLFAALSSSGANRDRTGDLLLAKRPLRRRTVRPTPPVCRGGWASSAMMRSLRMQVDCRRFSPTQALLAMSAWAAHNAFRVLWSTRYQGLG